MFVHCVWECEEKLDVEGSIPIVNFDWVEIWDSALFRTCVHSRSRLVDVDYRIHWMIKGLSSSDMEYLA